MFNIIRWTRQTWPKFKENEIRDIKVNYNI